MLKNVKLNLPEPEKQYLEGDQLQRDRLYLVYDRESKKQEGIAFLTSPEVIAYIDRVDSKGFSWDHREYLDYTVFREAPVGTTFSFEYEGFR